MSINTPSPHFFPLLHSRLSPPIISRALVQRQHILGWLESEKTAKLVMFRTPAGFGKTTLMSQWINQLREQGLPAVWLTLDETDNDPMRFLLDLFVALQESIPGFDLTTPEPHYASDSHDPQAIIHYLLEWLYKFKSQMAIFLDDFGVIRSQEVLDIFRQLLTSLPPGKKIVIAVRHAPDIGLAKLRAQDALVEINVQTLRFSIEETRQFIKMTQNLNLSERDVEYLYHLTEGWVTGLKLSTLSSIWQSRHLDKTQAKAMAFGFISDYLLEDVLVNQPKEVQDFLEKTSILNRLAGELCDAVTGRTDGYEMLAYLENNNLFLTPLDEERHWYSYHSVFAKFLRNRLERSGHNKLAALHRAAHDWYSSGNEVLEAARHAFLTGDADFAARYLEHCAFNLVQAGHSCSVFEWVNQLPPHVLDKRPRLQFAYVYSLIYQQQFDNALKMIDRILGDTLLADFAKKYYPNLRITQAYVFLCADRFRELEEVVKEAISQFENVKPIRTDGHIPILLNCAAALSLATGNLEGALKHIWESGRFLSEKTKVQFIYKGYIEGCIYLSQGKLNQTLELTHSTLDKVANTSHRFSAIGAGIAVLEAEALYERNKLTEAEDLLVKCRPMLATVTMLNIMIDGYRTLARIRLAKGDCLEAERYISELERLGVERGAPRASASARLERIHMALRQGKLQNALKIYQSHDDRAIWKVFEGYFMMGNNPETPEITRLRLLIANGKAKDALEPLNRELKKAEQSGYFRLVLLLRILTAKAQDACGKRKTALGLLKNAISSAQPEGFIRSFVDEGEPLPQMIREIYDIAVKEESMAGGSVPTAYLVQILSAMGKTAPLPTHSVSKPEPESPPVEGLTDREIDILDKLAMGFSSNELADQLFISVHTVRYHLRNIYSKLGAHSRVQAVAIARRFGLIE